MILNNYDNDVLFLGHIAITIGTFACAVSGTLRAIEAKLNVFAGLVLAIIMAVAGGTYRDLLLQIPVFWINDNFVIWFSIVVSICVFVVRYFCYSILTHDKIMKLLIFTDSVGLGMFCLIGVQKTLLHGHSYLCAIIFGVCTACGGGITVDMMTNRIPNVFFGSIYIFNAFIGSVLYLILLQTNISCFFAGFIAVNSMILCRMLSVKYNWHLLWRFLS